MLRTQQPPPKRAPYYAELAAYLAFREHGTTAEEFMAAFSLSPSTSRNYLSTLRELLGKDPVTGADYMPSAKTNPVAKARGVGVYLIEGMLVDADLFRRLRVRGQARGPAGMEDYATALRLVTGAPFSQLRDDGGTWLLEGDRIDHHLSLAIVDVAHALATSALAAGDTVAARAAVDIARQAAPDEETVRLDAAAVDVADGRTAEARRTLREDVCNRSDDGEPPHGPQPPHPPDPRPPPRLAHRQLTAGNLAGSHRHASQQQPHHQPPRRTPRPQRAAWNSQITDKGVTMGTANPVERVTPDTDAGLTPGRRYP